jgi:2-methylaconitate cis-trans-isomerase PrpF
MGGKGVGVRARFTGVAVAAEAPAGDQSLSRSLATGEVMPQESLEATVFRGGTSKGVYVREGEMPVDRDEWDALLLDAFGSPDPMQLDGIGGSHSTTSKAMVVSRSGARGADVDYRFGQVAVEKPVVDWGGNCGNLTFAIGPYAVERGLVDVDGPGRVELVLRNANTGDLIEQAVPVDPDGLPRYSGDFRVDGVAGTGARITSRFLDPGGAVTGSVFPTGDRRETLDVPVLGAVDVSLVDVSSPCVFVRAADVGVDAGALPGEIDADESLLERLEAVRSAACARLGFVDDAECATAESPGIPKLAVVGERSSYRTVNGDTVDPESYDLLARIMSMQKAHHAYAVTGAMCTAVAASIPGTVAADYLAADRQDEGDRPAEVVLGHPKGTMRVGVDLDGDDVVATTVDRTARQIMHGDLFYGA